MLSSAGQQQQHNLFWSIGSSHWHLIQSTATTRATPPSSTTTTIRTTTTTTTTTLKFLLCLAKCIRPRLGPWTDNRHTGASHTGFYCLVLDLTTGHGYQANHQVAPDNNNNLVWNYQVGLKILCLCSLPKFLFTFSLCVLASWQKVQVTTLSGHFEAFSGRSSYFSAPGPTNGSIFKASSQQMFLFLFLLVALILTSRAGPFHVAACR